MAYLGQQLSDEQQVAAFVGQFRSVDRVFVFLDYDGTIVPIQGHSSLAVLREEDQKKLRALALHPSIHLVIVSGRDRKFISRQFSDIKLDLAAEHGGYFFDRVAKAWSLFVKRSPDKWLDKARKILVPYQEQAPGSHIEEKELSIAWHYRLAPEDVAAKLCPMLIKELKSSLADEEVNILAGKMVVEARAKEANKGTFLAWFLESRDVDITRHAVIAIGDDETDEEMFAAATKWGGHAVKVGEGATCAHYRLPDPSQVLVLLTSLMSIMGTGKKGGGSRSQELLSGQTS